MRPRELDRPRWTPHAGRRLKQRCVLLPRVCVWLWLWLWLCGRSSQYTSPPRQDAAQAARRHAESLESQLQDARIALEEHAEKLSRVGQRADDLDRQCHQLRQDLQEAERQRVRAETAACESDRRRTSATNERRAAEAELRQVRTVALCAGWDTRQPTHAGTYHLASADVRRALRVCVCVCVWYHQVKAACADQTQRMQQMQTLAMQLEGSRDIQGEQLRQANHLRAEAEGQHRAALEDLSRARTSCAEREEEVLGLQRALAKLDEERDILQRELDRQSEELATVRTRDDALRSELERAGTAYSELQRALDDHRRALASREQEVRRVVGRLLATRCMSPFRAVDLTSPVCVAVRGVRWRLSQDSWKLPRPRRPKPWIHPPRRSRKWLPPRLTWRA